MDGPFKKVICRTESAVVQFVQAVSKANFYSDKLLNAATSKLKFGLEDLIHIFFERLESKYSPEIVKRVVAILSVSQIGLNESELLDVLSLDEPWLQRSVLSSGPHLNPNSLQQVLTEDGGMRYKWRFPQFALAASKRYLENRSKNSDITSCCASETSVFIGHQNGSISQVSISSGLLVSQIDINRSLSIDIIAANGSAIACSTTDSKIFHHSLGSTKTVEVGKSPFQASGIHLDADICIAFNQSQLAMFKFEKGRWKKLKPWAAYVDKIRSITTTASFIAVATATELLLYDKETFVIVSNAQIETLRLSKEDISCYA
ncbi:hypothetical protein HDU81_001194, partial [Chytriomyces hyalinus]